MFDNKNEVSGAVNEGLLTDQNQFVPSIDINSEFPTVGTLPENGETKIDVRVNSLADLKNYISTFETPQEQQEREKQNLEQEQQKTNYEQTRSDIKRKYQIWLEKQNNTDLDDVESLDDIEKLEDSERLDNVIFEIVYSDHHPINNKNLQYSLRSALNYRLQDPALTQAKSHFSRLNSSCGSDELYRLYEKKLEKREKEIGKEALFKGDMLEIVQDEVWDNFEQEIAQKISDINGEELKLLEKKAIEDAIYNGLYRYNEDITYRQRIEISYDPWSKLKQERKSLIVDDSVKLLDFMKKFDVDIDDPEIRSKSYNGFINIINSVNGEYSKHANWYFENFKYANNIEEFLGSMAAAKELHERGFKAKLTHFMNEHQVFDNSEVSEKQQRSPERLSDLENISNSSKVSPEYFHDLIIKLKTTYQLDGDYFQETGNKSSNPNSGIESPITPSRRMNEIYGFMKVDHLDTWGQFIEDNIDPNIGYYIEDFNSDGQKSGSPSRYAAIQFAIGDKSCVIAESFNDNAAMYIATGEIGENLRDLFRSSKEDARQKDNVECIYHLDKDNINDSLDESFSKAFLIIAGANKKDYSSSGKPYIFPTPASFEKNNQLVS